MPALAQHRSQRERGQSSPHSDPWDWEGNRGLCQAAISTQITQGFFQALLLVFPWFSHPRKHHWEQSLQGTQIYMLEFSLTGKKILIPSTEHLSCCKNTVSLNSAHFCSGRSLLSQASRISTSSLYSHQGKTDFLLLLFLLIS